MPKTKEDPAKKAQRILGMAPKVLLQVDQSYIFTHQESREFPQFDDQELVVGTLLGEGGFSFVHEIDRIMLFSSKTTSTSTSENNNNEEMVAPPASSSTPEEVKTDKQDIDGDGDASEDDDNDTEHDKHHHDDEDHYHVQSARRVMRNNYLRYGSARYAVKKLKPNLGIVDQARGAIDLAIEIKFLSTIWHPNIIKMRGYSKTPRVDIETFLILDRLYGTLNDKIEHWDKSDAVSKACCGRNLKRDPRVLEFLKDRLLVAYDLSSAITYLHGWNLLYRDLKPENVGFDVRGDLKLFDFGLMKSLEPSSRVADGGYGYQLTGMTGSVPYMAPEIALGKPYDRDADVYSFAMLLWEMLALEWAFNGYDARQYFTIVCAEDKRLPVDQSWPAMVRIIIEEGWDPNPQKRPNMIRIGSLLRGVLSDLTNDDAVINRTRHMLNRSTRSQSKMNTSQNRLESGVGKMNASTTTSTGGMNSSASRRKMDGSTGARRRSSLGASRSTRDMFLGGEVCGSSNN